MSVTPDIDDPAWPNSAASPRRRTAAERARHATRTRLLASAETLFAEHGLHGVTTHDIAAHAGVAAGTFYNHFADKDSLFREIAIEAVTDLHLRLAACRRLVPESHTAVRAQAEALTDVAQEKRNLIRILFSREADAAAVEADVLDGLAASIADEHSAAVRAGIANAEIDSAVLAQAIVGMWARVVAWWAEDPSRCARETVVDTLVRVQLGGTDPIPET